MFIRPSTHEIPDSPITPRKQERFWTCETPITAQNSQQLHRQHDIAGFAAFAHAQDGMAEGVVRGQGQVGVWYAPVYDLIGAGTFAQQQGEQGGQILLAFQSEFIRIFALHRRCGAWQSGQIQLGEQGKGEIGPGFAAGVGPSQKLEPIEGGGTQRVNLAAEPNTQLNK